MSKRKRFEVVGRGRFPIDMLRHDACWPVSGHDAHNIASSESESRSVVLLSDQQSSPCVDRWRSFGGVVVNTERL